MKRFCCDCKHHVEVTLPVSDPRGADLCAARPTIRVSLVNGPLRRFSACGAMRSSEGACGPDGALYEPTFGIRVRQWLGIVPKD
jgi:hypothetical protein